MPESWWADEMLGRLARYLRMTGLDTAYATGLRDEEVAARARAEGRVLLTRDRALAARVPGAVLLTQLGIAGQWRELKRRFPDLPTEPRCVRCTLCNGPLRPDPEELPPDRSTDTGPGPKSGPCIYRCATCGHEYWEGSHTESVRRRLRDWSADDRS